MDEKETKKMRKLLSILAVLEEDPLTRQEFVDSFDKVTNSVVAIEQRNQKGRDDLLKRIEAAVAQMTNDGTLTLSRVKAEIKKALDDALEQQRQSLNYLNDKVRSLRDGKDADEARVIESAKRAVLGEITLPEVKEMVLDTPEQLRDKLESLIGDERLRIDAIDGLEDVLSELRKERKVVVGGGPMAVGPGTVLLHDLSANLDGSTKTFNMPAFYRIVDVKLSSLPVLRPTVDYTVDNANNQITFTSEIDAATLLADGQSLIVLYAQS